MTVENIVLLVLVLTTIFNNGVQAYIHFEAYPLLAFVGKSEFATYLKEYENRLMVPLMLPYGLTLLSNLALIFIHPAELSVIAVIVLLALNVSVAGVTLQVATPVYNRIKQAEQAGEADMRQLMQINLVRLVLSTIASVVVLGMVGSLL